MWMKKPNAIVVVYSNAKQFDFSQSRMPKRRSYGHSGVALQPKFTRQLITEYILCRKILVSANEQMKSSILFLNTKHYGGC